MPTFYAYSVETVEGFTLKAGWSDAPGNVRGERCHGISGPARLIARRVTPPKLGLQLCRMLTGISRISRTFRLAIRPGYLTLRPWCLPPSLYSPIASIKCSRSPYDTHDAETVEAITDRSLHPLYQGSQGVKTVPVFVGSGERVGRSLKTLD